MSEYKKLQNEYQKLQNERDIKRIEKLISELEVTARHFRVGKIWNMVIEFRTAIAKEAGIIL